jgi:hypothetical protein
MSGFAGLNLPNSLKRENVESGGLKQNYLKVSADHVAGKVATIVKKTDTLRTNNYLGMKRRLYTISMGVPVSASR